MSTVNEAAEFCPLIFPLDLFGYYLMINDINNLAKCFN